MNVEVVVVRTPKGYLVRPAYVIVQGGDTIRWRNLTRRGIQVLLPRVTPGADSFREDRETGEAQILIPEGAATGFYPYAVYSAEANDTCLGESGPGVIIKA